MSDLAESSWFLELLERFELAWIKGPRPSLDLFLEEALDRLDGDWNASRRSDALVQLLRTEIEFGWAAHHRSGVPSASELELPGFANRFGDLLGGSDRWPDDLIVSDFLHRGRHDPSETVGSILAGFPGREEILGPRLRAIARERPPRIAGYLVDRKLGVGGQGEVWLARSIAVPREVAIKVLWSRDPDRLERLNRELKALGALGGRTGIVVIHDARLDAEPPHLVMEYVRGGDLENKVRALEPGGSPNLPSARSAARIVQRLAEAVHQVHKEPVNMLHRDLKPANVLVDGPDAEGSGPDDWEKVEPKLADFGMVRLSDRDRNVTESGKTVGSPPYMAPEQIDDRLGLTDARTDVYGLGGILYFLIYGKAPFDTHHRDPRIEPVFPGKIGDPNLVAICRKAMAVDSTRRYDNALKLAEELGRFLDGQPIEARPPSRRERVVRWVKRRPAVSSLLAASVVFALVSYGFLVREYAQSLKIREYAATTTEVLNSLGFSLLIDPELKAQTTVGFRNRKFAEARRVLDRFLELEGDSVESLRLSGRAGLALTEIEQVFRRPKEAIQAIERAENDFRRLAERAGTLATIEDHLGLGTALMKRGTMQAQYLGDLPGAILILREAERRIEALDPAQLGKDPDVTARLANTRNSLALCLAWRGEAEEALSLFRTAIASYDRMTGEFPTLGDPRSQAIRIRSNFAMFLEELGDPAAGLVHQEAIDRARAAILEVEQARTSMIDPNHRLLWEWEYREALAVAANNGAEYASRRGDFSTAVPLFETTRDEYDLLARRDPEKTDNPWGAAMARTNLAIALTGESAGSWAQATSLFDQANAAYQRLEKLNKLGDVEFRAYRAKYHLYRGILRSRQALAENRPMDLALRAFDEATLILGPRQTPSEDTILQVEILLRVAEIQIREADPGASGSLRDAAQLLVAAQAKFPKVVIYQTQRVVLGLLWADLESRTSKLDEAADRLAKARQAIDQLSEAGRWDLAGERVRNRAGYLAAALLAARGSDPDRAIDELETLGRAEEFHWPDRRALLKADDRFRAIRDNPRFRALITSPETGPLPDHRGVAELDESR